jgi:hypothetical protein
MFSLIKRWYNGEQKIRKNDPESLVSFVPGVYTEYHWSAKIARAIVAFYLRHWQWVWGMIIAIVSLYISVLALK